MLRGEYFSEKQHMGQKRDLQIYLICMSEKKNIQSPVADIFNHCHLGFHFNNDTMI